MGSDIEFIREVFRDPTIDFVDPDTISDEEAESGIREREYANMVLEILAVEHVCRIRDCLPDTVFE